MVFEPNLDKNMFDEVLDIKEMCQARGNPPNFYYEASQNLVPTCPKWCLSIGENL